MMQNASFETLHTDTIPVLSGSGLASAQHQQPQGQGPAVRARASDLTRLTELPTDASPWCSAGPVGTAAAMILGSWWTPGGTPHVLCMRVQILANMPADAPGHVPGHAQVQQTRRVQGTGASPADLLPHMATDRGAGSPAGPPQ